MDTITIKLRAQNGNEYPETYVVDNLSKVSDGYHTIAELYDHRITLWIALCKSWQGQYDKPELKPCWRSLLHSDGTRYENWFLLGLFSAQGKMITYHVPIERWDETGFAVTLEKGHFDGHTSVDVLDRLKKL